MNENWYIETGERIAKIETILVRMEARKPCEDCKNVVPLANIKLNLRIINWVGSVLTASALYKLGQWLFDKVITPYQ